MRFVLTLLLFTACQKSQSAKTEGEGTDAAFVRARKGMLEERIDSPGVVRSERRVEVRADREVKIAAIKVSDYQPVKKGDVLMILDTKDAVQKKNEIGDRKKAHEIQMKTVRSRLRNSQKNLGRKRELFNKGIIAEADYERAQQEYETNFGESKTKELEGEKLDRELAEVEAGVKSANYLAPIDGVVSELPVGNASGPIGAGRMLAAVSDPERLGIWSKVSEFLVPRLKVGMPVEVKLDALPGKVLAGKISQIGTSPVASTGGLTKEFELVVAIERGDAAIREGYQGSIGLSLARRESAVIVPLSSVKYSEGNPFVLVRKANGQAAEARAVKTGLRSAGELEIVEGLASDETVAVK